MSEVEQVTAILTDVLGRMIKSGDYVRGLLDERAATVAFLKKQGYRQVADALERKEHLK